MRSHHVASLTADKVREILVNQIHRTGHLNTHADLIISEQAAAGLTVLIYGLNPGPDPACWPIQDVSAERFRILIARVRALGAP